MKIRKKILDAIEEAQDLLEKNTVYVGEVDIKPYHGLYSYAADRDGYTEIRISTRAYLQDLVRPGLLLHTVLHEYGHAWLFKYWDILEKPDKKEFRRVFGKVETEEVYTHMLFRHQAYISRYAQVSPHEDWAETFVSMFIETDYPTDEVEDKAEFLWDLLTRYEEALQ